MIFLFYFILLFLPLLISLLIPLLYVLPHFPNTNTLSLPLLLSIQVPGAPVEQPPAPVPRPIVASLDVTAKMRISVTCVNVTVQPTQVMLTLFNGTGGLFQAPETTVTRTFTVPIAI